MAYTDVFRGPLDPSINKYVYNMLRAIYFRRCLPEVEDCIFCSIAIFWK